MNGKKKLLIVLLLLVILAAAVLGVFWSLSQFVIVDLKFYPKNETLLNLQGQELTYGHYDTLQQKLPQTRILWDVPFQDGTQPSDSTSLTITALSEEDVALLDYFPELKTVDAKRCTDYLTLMALQQRRPEVDVVYSVKLGGSEYPLDTKEAVLSGITEEEIPLLQCLTQLETVSVTGGGEETIAALQKYCREQGYRFRLNIGGTDIDDRAEEVVIENIAQEELALLQFLPNLTKIHLETPEASAESLIALRAQYANVEVSWTQTVCGKLYPHTETLIDISNIEVTDLEALEREMTYFPDAAQLEMHFCGVENETMAAFREKHREDYKVVWTVMLGPKLPTRTDTTSIMPARDGTSVFHDEEAYNMRYCEDVIAVDVGHLDVRNVEWAAYMPHLKYLILAWTGVRDLTPLSNCKELVWLELDYSPVTDTTPLIGCTALEDINIGASSIDPSGLCQMPWLKNVWAIFNPGAGYKVAQACPDTRVVATGSHTVSSGWRHLPNYYAMRDALGMFYMDQ